MKTPSLHYDNVIRGKRPEQRKYWNDQLIDKLSKVHPTWSRLEIVRNYGLNVD